MGHVAGRGSSAPATNGPGGGPQDRWIWGCTHSSRGASNAAGKERCRAKWDGAEWAAPAEGHFWLGRQFCFALSREPPAPKSAVARRSAAPHRGCGGVKLGGQMGQRPVGAERARRMLTPKIKWTKSRGAFARPNCGLRFGIRDSVEKKARQTRPPGGSAHSRQAAQPQ